MILDPADRLLVIHRRLFENDQSRFFVGKVDVYQDGMARVTGYTFARDNLNGNYIKKSDRRTKVFAIASGTLITHVLPSDFNVDQANFEVRDYGLCLTDGSDFVMNVSEWVHKS